MLGSTVFEKSRVRDSKLMQKKSLSKKRRRDARIDRSVSSGGDEESGRMANTLDAMIRARCCRTTAVSQSQHNKQARLSSFLLLLAPCQPSLCQPHSQSQSVR